VAPANAHPWIRERVHWRTVACGGFGGGRELCDLLLAAQGKAEAALEEALQSHTPSAQLTTPELAQ
jgi:3-deoxy-D-manno-octulosonate 8-phosphate phosphatase (KDO 8-P phosphatase)